MALGSMRPAFGHALPCSMRDCLDPQWSSYSAVLPTTRSVEPRSATQAQHGVRGSLHSRWAEVGRSTLAPPVEVASREAHGGTAIPTPERKQGDGLGQRLAHFDDSVPSAGSGRRRECKDSRGRTFPDCRRSLSTLSPPDAATVPYGPPYATPPVGRRAPSYVPRGSSRCSRRVGRRGREPLCRSRRCRLARAGGRAPTGWLIHLLHRVGAIPPRSLILTIEVCYQLPRVLGNGTARDRCAAGRAPAGPFVRPVKRCFG